MAAIDAWPSIPSKPQYPAPMRYVLYLLAALALLNGFSISARAASSIHQIYASVNYLCSAVLLAGAVVACEVAKLRPKPAGDESMLSEGKLASQAVGRHLPAK